MNSIEIFEIELKDFLAKNKKLPIPNIFYKFKIPPVSQTLIVPYLIQQNIFQKDSITKIFFASMKTEVEKMIDEIQICYQNFHWQKKCQEMALILICSCCCFVGNKVEDLRDVTNLRIFEEKCNEILHKFEENLMKSEGIIASLIFVIECNRFVPQIFFKKYKVVPYQLFE